MDLPPELRDKLLVFFADLADGYLQHAEELKCGDNWQSHRIKLGTLAAFEMGDARRMNQAEHDFKQQVSCNVRADGSVEDFFKRDALHYVVYDLEPLETAALAAKAHGMEWFHYQPTGGGSVAAAVEWLLPYAVGMRQHEEYVYSTEPFDAIRDKAGMKGFSGSWDAAESVNVLILAALLDAKFVQPKDDFMARTKAQPILWLQVATKLQVKNKN
jgi:hypothetical protein